MSGWAFSFSLIFFVCPWEGKLLAYTVVPLGVISNTWGLTTGGSIEEGFEMTCLRTWCVNARRYTIQSRPGKLKDPQGLAG